MSGVLKNELNFDYFIKILKDYTENGTNKNKLKKLAITEAGYKVFVNKEMIPTFSLAVRLSAATNIDIMEFYNFKN